MNLKGTLYGCQAAGAKMVQQGSGSIINMASAAVLAPTPGVGPYAITKAGVVQLTRTMALEVGRQGVRVNCREAPGFVPTNMTARYYVRPDGTVDEAARAAVLGPHGPLRPPAPGRPARPISPTACCTWRRTPRSFVTGQVLRPNGGVSAH